MAARECVKSSRKFLFAYAGRTELRRYIYLYFTEQPYGRELGVFPGRF